MGDRAAAHMRTDRGRTRTRAAAGWTWTRAWRSSSPRPAQPHNPRLGLREPCTLERQRLNARAQRFLNARARAQRFLNAMGTLSLRREHLRAAGPATAGGKGAPGTRFLVLLAGPRLYLRRRSAAQPAERRGPAQPRGDVRPPPFFKEGRESPSRYSIITRGPGSVSNIMR